MLFLTLHAQEMKDLMGKGRLLDELWRVAEGKWNYRDYREKVIRWGTVRTPCLPYDLAARLTA
jgi:hypothetical protein